MSNKVNQVIDRLLLNHFFFASLLFRNPMIEDSTCETAYTNGDVIGYNPVFFDSLSLSEIEGVTVHEIMHIILMHHLRRGDRNFRTWNMACDYAINLILIDQGFTLPKGCLFESKFEGMEAEEIYSQLVQKQKDEKKQEDEQDKQGKGKDKPNNQNASQGQSGGSKGETFDNPCGEVRDMVKASGGKLSESEKTEKIQDQIIANQTAQLSTKKQGKNANSIERLVGIANHQSVIDWRDILARFVDQTSKSDYSWSKPNRRFLQGGIYLPSLYSDSFQRVVLAVDTSGSITENQLSAMVSGCLDCLSCYEQNGQDPELDVIYCDSVIQRVETLGIDSKPNPKGGGGTDFAPVFAYLPKLEVEPSAIIYLTDGYCQSFGVAPDVPVLWVLNRTNNYFKPPFGEVVKLQIAS